MPNRRVPVSTTTVPVVAYNAKRKALIVFNSGVDDVFLSEDIPRITTDGTPIKPLTAFVANGRNAALAQYAQANSGTQNLQVYEGFGDEGELVSAVLAGTATARPSWFDRTPIQRVQAFIGGSLAPHANTTRWTYTVPAAKKAFVSFAENKIFRVSPYTGAGGPGATISLTPSGGAATTLSQTSISTNEKGSRDQDTVGQGMTLLAGDALAAATSDDSTGGTASYFLTAQIIEFDA